MTRGSPLSARTRTMQTASIQDVVQRFDLNFNAINCNSECPNTSLCDLKVDTATIITALLHDTIEDTEATYNEVNKLFGKEIADLVEGVTKISRLEDKSKEYSVAENFRKLILATSKDIRVLLVKLADRLHNMRTINNITNPDKRLRIAKETMEIYSPLAERMYLETMEKVLSGVNKIIIDKQSGSGVVPYLPLPELKKNLPIEQKKSEVKN